MPRSGCPTNINRVTQEFQAVRELKRQLSKDSVPKISQFQYANTPSCDRGLPFGLDWHLFGALEFNQNFSGERYWGSHYPRLTRIKAAWDPDNVFHHCHSVASTAQQCCPFWLCTQCDFKACLDVISQLQSQKILARIIFPIGCSWVFGWIMDFG